MIPHNLLLSTNSRNSCHHRWHAHLPPSFLSRSQWAVLPKSALSSKMSVNSWKKKGYATGTTIICTNNQGHNKSSKIYTQYVIADRIKVCKIMSRCLQGRHRCRAIMCDGHNCLAGIGDGLTVNICVLVLTLVLLIWLWLRIDTGTGTGLEAPTWTWTWKNPNPGYRSIPYPPTHGSSMAWTCGYGLQLRDGCQLSQ
jgi:hypothetical protein